MISCKSHSSLVELIDIDVDLEEFEKFEGEFERDEVVEV